MKLIINYDLIKRIQQAKEDFGISVALKKNIKQVAPLFGIYTAFNLASGQRIDQALSNATLSASLLLTLWATMDLARYHFLGDIDKRNALNDLKKLSIQLGQFNISTSVDLLLKSEEYDRKYKLELNENKLPSVLQEKYILVPTYNNGDIKDTSILQEHVIGSKIYVLSLGSPAKAFKPAFAGI